MSLLYVSHRNVISLGAAFSAWHRGWHPSFASRSNINEFRTHPDDCWYHFGLNWQEIEDHTPAQITWFNSDPDTWIYDQPDLVITDDMLDDRVVESWRTFLADVLCPAQEEKRIQWNVCKTAPKSYWDYAAYLKASGQQVLNYVNKPS